MSNERQHIDENDKEYKSVGIYDSSSGYVTKSEILDNDGVSEQVFTITQNLPKKYICEIKETNRNNSIAVMSRLMRPDGTVLDLSSVHNEFDEYVDNSLITDEAKKQKTSGKRRCRDRMKEDSAQAVAQKKNITLLVDICSKLGIKVGSEDADAINNALLLLKKMREEKSIEGNIKYEVKSVADKTVSIDHPKTSPKIAKMVRDVCR